MGVRMRLIDWIAVILVIVVCDLFLLPIFEGHPGVSRVARCRNNLRQIALALAAYESRLGTYPPSVDLAHGQSCFQYLMLDMDQMDIFNAYNMSLTNWSEVDNGSGRSNAELGATSLSILRCPSSPFQERATASEIVRLDGSHYPGSALFAKSHYAVNWGGDRQGRESEFERLYGVSRGPMNSTGRLSKRDVTDGASSTILLAEKRDSFGWNVGGWAGSEFDVGTQPGDEGNEPIASKVYTGAYHEGGLNVVFVDGSVRFLRNRTDRRVWHAMITRNGGELLSVDHSGNWHVTFPERVKR